MPEYIPPCFFFVIFVFYTSVGEALVKHRGYTTVKFETVEEYTKNSIVALA